jgi:hypothetical protein
MLPTSMALVSTVALLVSMAFFMLGSLPLLVLKHDTPLDARFIRGVFNTYYVAVMLVAGVGTLSYAFAERPGFSLGMGCVAALAYASRRWVLSRMDVLRSTMKADDSAAIRRFRRLHVGGMLANAAQLGAVVWSMTGLAV